MEIRQDCVHVLLLDAEPLGKRKPHALPRHSRYEPTPAYVERIGIALLQVGRVLTKDPEITGASNR